MGKNNHGMPPGLRFGPTDGLDADLPMKHTVPECNTYTETLVCVRAKKNWLQELRRGVKSIVAGTGRVRLLLPSEDDVEHVVRAKFLGHAVEHCRPPTSRPLRIEVRYSDRNYWKWITRPVLLTIQPSCTSNSDNFNSRVLDAGRSLACP